MYDAAVVAGLVPGNGGLFVDDGDVGIGAVDRELAGGGDTDNARPDDDDPHATDQCRASGALVRPQ